MGENFQRGATRGTLRGNGAVTFFCGREAAAKKCMKHRIAERRTPNAERRSPFRFVSFRFVSFRFVSFRTYVDFNFWLALQNPR